MVLIKINGRFVPNDETILLSYPNLDTLEIIAQGGTLVSKEFANQISRSVFRLTKLCKGDIIFNGRIIEKTRIKLMEVR